MRETTGGVFDTLAQIHLIRGEYEAANRYLEKAREAYGEYGMPGTRWYQWSLHLLGARLALRRGDHGPSVSLASGIARAPEAPPAYALQAELVVVEACSAAGRPTCWAAHSATAKASPRRSTRSVTAAPLRGLRG